LLWAYNPVVVTPQSITKFSGIVFKKAATVRFDKMTNLVPHDIKLRVPFSGGKVLRLPWVNFTFETAGQTEAVGSTEETQAGMPINRLRGVRREQADLISATYERYKSS
jgi:hypothetical protein